VWVSRVALYIRGFIIIIFSYDRFGSCCAESLDEDVYGMCWPYSITSVNSVMHTIPGFPPRVPLG